MSFKFLVFVDHHKLWTILIRHCCKPWWSSASVWRLKQYLTNHLKNPATLNSILKYFDTSVSTECNNLSRRQSWVFLRRTLFEFLLSKIFLQCALHFRASFAILWLVSFYNNVYQSSFLEKDLFILTHIWGMDLHKGSWYLNRILFFNFWAGLSYCWNFCRCWSRCKTTHQSQRFR